MLSATVPISASFSLRRRFAITSLIVIVGIALGLGWLLSDMLTERMLRREGEVSMEFIRNLLSTDRSADFLREPQDRELRNRFLNSMEHLSSMTEPVRANAFGPDGTVVWSTDHNLIGRRDADNEELQEALRGDLVVHSGTLGSQTEKLEHQGLSQQTHYYVESYIPILADELSSQVLGVIELYKVPVQLSAAIRAAVLQLWVACAGSALVLFLALNGVVGRADRIMREQQAKLSESQALSSAVELAGAVAHNLRNPLASIRTAAEMMDGNAAHLADQAEHREDIIQSVDRANRWITELVRVSHASQLPLAPVATTPMWRDCLQELQPEMTRQRVVWQLQEGEAPEVLAHAAMLRQILLSVLANAIEAMPRGGPMAIGWQEQEGQLHLTVDDAGSGVSEEVRQALFRPFFSTKSGGLGIGLALARRTLAQWNGTIDLFSRNGTGTRVVITLPLVEGNG
ncbi:MAG TPA: ATP-binding protein [Ramlibacter sp.]|uniref:sensor histidine kinase n=1 Tax=Ramlibacter sp. TaxID=1917967 RepID=UPI002D7E3B86|nr:ATP-binding protein [Ramlibacter sp.]HET8745971.1 ATP-binding protein [Ramlibacter sp.]